MHIVLQWKTADSSYLQQFNSLQLRILLKHTLEGHSLMTATESIWYKILFKWLQHILSHYWRGI